MNIYQKMLAATSEIATVAKNLTVDQGAGRSYKAVSEADVLNAIRPIEIKYNIYSFPLSRRIVESGEIVTTRNYKGEQQESKRLFMRIETVYRFVNCENPDEYIDVTTYGDGVDSQDKAPGKAMTYADKYALLKAYKIRTGDDPDQEASEELVSKNSNKSVELITESEQQVLKNMCKSRGLDPEKVFPNGLNLPAEMYAEAVEKLGKIKVKSNENDGNN